LRGLEKTHFEKEAQKYEVPRLPYFVAVHIAFEFEAFDESYYTFRIFVHHVV